MSTATPTRTAPLPPAVVDAVTRYETATVRFDELAARPADTLSDGETANYFAAQGVIYEALGVLADAGRLDLIAPADTAARYRQAASHYVTLTACGDYEGCEYVQDEMRMCRCQLAKAGRLDLIGVA